MQGKYDKYVSATLLLFEVVVLATGWRKIRGVWDFFTAEILHSFKNMPDIYKYLSPFSFTVNTKGIQITYPFAIVYCVVLLIQYCLILYIMIEFGACMKEYFHLRRVSLNKYFKRMSLSFWGISVIVVVLQVFDSVLSQKIRFFKPDFLTGLVAAWFIAIVLHYVAVMLTNTNKYKN